MSAESLARDNNRRQSIIQQLNDEFQRKYDAEQAWLETIDRLSFDRTQ